MGEPGGGHAPPSAPEYIGCARTTRGTETSKYPEEEKSTEIARVAASESAPAQTRWVGEPQGDSHRGLRAALTRGLEPGARLERDAGAERHGKAGRSG